MVKNDSNAGKFNSDLCDDKMTFNDCELAILRHTVDEIDNSRPISNVNSEDVAKMINILETFLIRKKLICYGGTAINNVLPKNAQFYNRDIEVPDYDFYSSRPMEDAIELADIYYAEGYAEVEAKVGVHHGTYKVYVNFIGMADITYLPEAIFKEIEKDAIMVAGIKYAPINFLRMNMFLELSRPNGDVSRWEKVLKRLTLLNKYYPLKPQHDCLAVDFQRKLSTKVDDSERLYIIVRDVFIETGVIFFGGYASSLYSQYMTVTNRRLVDKIPDFDVLSEDIDKVAMIVANTLAENGFTDVKTVVNEPVGEIISRHIEIRVGKETLAFIYTPVSCHSYNTITINKKDVRVATIDTMLTFYLAFYYINDPLKYNRDRLLCMAKFLFDVEQKNRLEQKGLLKRFSINCYGKQDTLDDMRNQKTQKYKELAGLKGTREYDEWFLKYEPSINKHPVYLSTKNDKPVSGYNKYNKPNRNNDKKRGKRFTRKPYKFIKKRAHKRRTLKNDYLY